MVNAYFDTGLNSYVEGQYGILECLQNSGAGEGNTRILDYSTSESKHFFLYTSVEAAQQYHGELWLAWGNDDSWSEVQIWDYDWSDTVGLLGVGRPDTSGDSNYLAGALAIDNVHDELHVIIQTEKNALWHAFCTDMSAPQTIGNWHDFGSSTYYQRVDNGTDCKRCDIDVMDSDGTYGRVYIVYERVGSGIYLNACDASANHIITVGDEVTISSGGNDITGSITCVHENDRDVVYVSWNNLAATFQTEVKRCTTATSNWDSAGNWLGPVTGTTTPDVPIGNWGSADEMSAGGITHFYSGDSHYEQVFIASNLIQSAVAARCYDNWYDAGNYTGSGPGWDSADGTYTLENYNAHSSAFRSWPSVVGLDSDFRIHLSGEWGTGGYADSRRYADTDQGINSYTHGTFAYTPDSGSTGDSEAAPGISRSERHAHDTGNNYTALIAVDTDSYAATVDIYVVYPAEPGEQAQGAAMGVGSDYVPSLDIELQLECSMGAGTDFGFDDFNIYCTLSVGASMGIQFQIPLDCAMGVGMDESAAPDNQGPDEGETVPDTLDWTVVCTG